MAEFPTDARVLRNPQPHATSGSVWQAMIAVLLATLLLPIHPSFAGLRIDPYRILLLIAIAPLCFGVLSGRAGRANFVDVSIFGFSAWIFITLVYHHGNPRIPYALISAVELLGGYLAGRVLVRSAGDYRIFLRYFMWSLLILMPFALVELVTGRVPISEFFQRFVEVTPKIIDERFNLVRAQTVFPHPILFGVFCTVPFASIYFLSKGRLSMLVRLTLVCITTFTSLSSAAFLSLLAQGGLIIWGKLTRDRWWLLIGIAGFIFLSLEILSNRGPVILLIEKFTLSPETAWWRVYIWIYGTQNVLANPIMGIGLNDWVRPYWLADTVDNFWLVIAMRHGLPAFVFVAVGIAVHITRIVRAKLATDELMQVRKGYLISLVGLLLTLCTVHAWDALTVVVMFIIGAGSFLYQKPQLAAALTTAGSGTVLASRRKGQTSAPVISHPADIKVLARKNLPYSRFAANRTRSGNDRRPL